MPLIDRFPGAVAFRQVTPRDTGADPEEDSVDHGAVVIPPPAPAAREWQVRLQKRPLAIRQIPPTHNRINEQPVRRSHDPPDSA
ncbi:hypothetical protein GCM10010433_44130 [Streptomyces pulveraceus]